jgi:hypothetical protein
MTAAGGQPGSQLGRSYAVRDNFAFTFAVLAGRFPASPRARVHLGFAYEPADTYQKRNQ